MKINLLFYYLYCSIASVSAMQEADVSLGKKFNDLIERKFSYIKVITDNNKKVVSLNKELEEIKILKERVEGLSKNIDESKLKSERGLERKNALKRDVFKNKINLAISVFSAFSVFFRENIFKKNLMFISEDRIKLLYGLILLVNIKIASELYFSSCDLSKEFISDVNKTNNYLVDSLEIYKEVLGENNINSLLSKKDNSDFNDLVKLFIYDKENELKCMLLSFEKKIWDASKDTKNLKFDQFLIELSSIVFSYPNISLIESIRETAIYKEKMNNSDVNFYKLLENCFNEDAIRKDMKNDFKIRDEFSYKCLREWKGNYKEEELVGYDHILKEYKEVVRSIFSGEEIKNYSPGILFYGPPGTGKTELAKSIIYSASDNEEDCLVFNIGSDDIREARDLSLLKDQVCDLAKDGKSVVIYIDEIEGLIKNRSNLKISAREVSIVTEFLKFINELQGKRIIVLAMTNSIDSIDEAVIREGRFVQKFVGLPDYKARKVFIEGLLVEEIKDKDKIVNVLLYLTSGFNIPRIINFVRDIESIERLAQKIINTFLGENALDYEEVIKIINDEDEAFWIKVANDEDKKDPFIRSVDFSGSIKIKKPLTVFHCEVKREVTEVSNGQLLLKLMDYQEELKKERENKEKAFKRMTESFEASLVSFTEALKDTKSKEKDYLELTRNKEEEFKRMMSENQEELKKERENKEEAFKRMTESFEASLNTFKESLKDTQSQENDYLNLAKQMGNIYKMHDEISRDQLESIKQLQEGFRDSIDKSEEVNKATFEMFKNMKDSFTLVNSALTATLDRCPQLEAKMAEGYSESMQKISKDSQEFISVLTQVAKKNTDMTSKLILATLTEKMGSQEKIFNALVDSFQGQIQKDREKANADFKKLTDSVWEKYNSETKLGLDMAISSGFNKIREKVETLAKTNARVTTMELLEAHNKAKV